MGGKLTVQTGPDGRWSTPLQCNDDLTPVGTLYQITEKIPSAYGGAKVYLIQVLTGLPVAPAINEVLNSIVPAAVPVGGSYAPVGSGPQGIQGPQGPPGSIPVADNAALLALTPKVEGLPIYVQNTECVWAWDSTAYRLQNFPRFIGSTAADTALSGVTTLSGLHYYRASNSIDEGPYYKDSNNTYTRPWHSPWGIIARNTIWRPTPIAITGTAAGLHVSGLNVFSVLRRQYRLVCFIHAITTTNNCSFIVLVFKDGVQVANTQSSHIGAVTGNHRSEVWLTGDGAAWAIDFRGYVNAGTATAYADLPTSQTYVEDVGPTGSPS